MNLFTQVTLTGLGFEPTAFWFITNCLDFTPGFY